MNRIEPFSGLVYNRKKTGNLAKVVAPPYDVISPEEQAALYRAHPNNIIRLILNQEQPGDSPGRDTYARAASFFREWQDNEILIRDRTPAFYFYVQNFSLPTGESFQREGFFGRLELSPFEDKKVIPHEHTLPKPRKDRMKLMLKCRAHLSPIFVLYNDSRRTFESIMKSVIERKPYLDTVDKNKVRHRAWTVSDPDVIDALRRALGAKTFIIADGHHRYNAALEVRNAIRKRQKRQAPAGQPYDYAMAYFCNMQSPGLTILPIHRMIHSMQKFQRQEILGKLGSYFSISEITFTSQKLASATRDVQEKLRSPEYAAAGSFGLFFPGGNCIYLLRGKKAAVRKALGEKGIPEGIRKLDVVSLHEIIFQEILGISRDDVAKQKNVRYVNGIIDLPPVLKKGDFQALFILNPITFPVLRSVTKTGLCLPQKATYFYPKLLSGVVLHPFE